MTVSEIYDISPLLFFINFEITLADARGDFELIKNDSGDISQITLSGM